MRTFVCCSIIMLCMAMPALAKKKVQWIDRQDALHLAENNFDKFIVASCATVPEAGMAWAYCAWRKQGCNDNYAEIPEGYFDCKTNDVDGNCTIAAEIRFRENYGGAVVSMVNKTLVTEGSVNVQCDDQVVQQLLADSSTRRLVRRLLFNELPGNGSLGNYTQEGKAQFKVEYTTNPLLPGYERVETEGTGKKDVKIALDSLVHPWMIWQVLNSKPAAASQTHVGKRYCRANGTARDLYECRPSAGLLAATAGEPSQPVVAMNNTFSGDLTSPQPGPFLPPHPVQPVDPPEPADEPGYTWAKIATLPSNVRYMSVAQ